MHQQILVTVEPLVEMLQRYPSFPVGWRLQAQPFAQGDATVHAWRAVDDRRGSVVMLGIIDRSDLAHANMWAQPAFFERPGEVFLPIQRRQTAQGPRWYVGLVTILRPVVLRSNEAGAYGILSLEAPRGIGEGIAERSRFVELPSVGAGSMEELIEETRLVPARAPEPAGVLNPNTTYFATAPPGYIVEVERGSERRFPDGGIVLPPGERIDRLAFYRWPEEIVPIISAGRTGDVMFCCDFTRAILFEFACRYGLLKP